MDAKEWKRRKELGLCGYHKCDSPRVKGAYCEPHYALHRGWQSTSMKRDYWRRKLAGNCVWRGCSAPAGETGHCDPHREEFRAMMRKIGKRVDRKRQMARAQRRRAKVRKRLGLCVRCNDPVVTETLCERHRLYVLERARLRRLAAGIRPTPSCESCGQPSHPYFKCGERGRDLAPIEHYATARTFVEVE